MKTALAALCLFACAAQAETVMSPAPPTDRGWQAKSGTSNVDTPVQTEAACWALAHAKAERDKKSGNFTCINTKAARIDYKAPVVVPPVVVPPVVTPTDPHNGGVQPGNQPRYNVASIPAPARGSSTFDVGGTGQWPYQTPGETSGAFRTRCDMSHFNRDDSLVYPGQVGRAHLHMYFGNTGSNANSTPESIRTTGNSTCRGGIANRSTYWVPAVIDTASGNVMRMAYADVYYKTGYLGVRNEDVKPIPQGLRMIAGDMTRSTAPPEETFFRFACGGRYGSTMPTGCTSGTVEISISFPQCWDGRNLSAPDHKSHMAYASKGCPASHPVALPEIAYIMHFEIPAGSNTSNWRLSSDNYVGGRGGYSMHADWINGWDVTLPPIWTSLIINKGLSGGSHMIGDGRSMN